MRRKYENIAIILFLINLVILIIGIVLVQQSLTESTRTQNIDMLHNQIVTHGKDLIILFVLLSIIAIIMLVLFFKTSADVKKQFIDKDTAEGIDKNIAESIIKEESKFKNLKELELQKFNTLKQKIEVLGTQELDISQFCNACLSAIATEYEVFQGLFYIVEDQLLAARGSYAYNQRVDKTLQLGEGLAGQVAKAKRTVNIKQIPAGYIKAISGLGESTPSNLLICPLVTDNNTIAVIEIASFKEFSKDEEQYFGTLGEIIKEKLSNLN